MSDNVLEHSKDRRRRHFEIEEQHLAREVRIIQKTKNLSEVEIKALR